MSCWTAPLTSRRRVNRTLWPPSRLLSREQLFDNSLFDPVLNNTLTAVRPGTIGNSPRSICCGPGINNTDVSFNKSTQISERLRMEFRGDIFNVWNHAQFYSVDGNVGNQGATFGQPLKIRD